MFGISELIMNDDQMLLRHKTSEPIRFQYVNSGLVLTGARLHG